MLFRSPVGLGYYEDPQSQQQQQGVAANGGGYELGEGVVDEHEHISSHDHGETTVLPLMNGHTTAAGGVYESTTNKLDDDCHTAAPPTTVLLSKEKEGEEINKPNGVFKHDQQYRDGDEGEGYDDGEEVEEEEEEEEDVVFVMGTDVSTSWTTPERERRA